MATRKQIVTVSLIAFTVLAMFFFLTSDYRFNFSFSANSHPLKLQRGYTTPYGKFFPQDDNVDVSVYEGEDGEVVPDALTPPPFTSSPPVVTLNTGEQITKEMLRNVLAGDKKEEEEEEGDILMAAEEGMSGGEFPQVEINHHPEKESVRESTASDTTTSEISTTKLTTETPTTTPTTPTSPTSSLSPSISTKGAGGNGSKFLKKGHIVAKRHLNMIQTTAETETRSMISTSEPTSVKSTEEALTEPAEVPATEAVSSTNTSVTAAVSASKQTEELESSEHVVSRLVTQDTAAVTPGAAAVTPGAVPVSVAPTIAHVPAENTTSSSTQSSNSSEEKSQGEGEGGNPSHVNEVMSHVDQDNVVVKEMDLPDEFQSEETNETLIY